MDDHQGEQEAKSYESYNRSKNSDGSNYAEWADHIEQKNSQQKLRGYLMSSNRFDHYDEEDVYVAKSYINLSVHRDNLKTSPSTSFKEVHEKTTIVNKILLRRELSTLSWKPHEAYATFIHNKLFEAGDMTPETDRIVEFLYLLPPSFEAWVDSILERITKQELEY
ncbi:hypothetical protein H257_17723 [Aphanomyces astaci]|uniref:Uncharacterized protein n=1 Tax=Aphanomyces astaci TaxID=112090 RepID=W4FFH1_APHAT|nr:hypothetical protein H257_17723 [Aphanomyces astaci]ETV65614.1 hypothetical protein H257_17723 [Aphanomyces astaci]|eukprot:XP_009844911.1 hypothetical protein H257_17723 [Aphanomyces astaci]